MLDFIAQATKELADGVSLDTVIQHIVESGVDTDAIVVVQKALESTFREPLNVDDIRAMIENSKLQIRVPDLLFQCRPQRSSR